MAVVGGNLRVCRSMAITTLPRDIRFLDWSGLYGALTPVTLR
jgi:hypothetical protein